MTEEKSDDGLEHLKSVRKMLKETLQDSIVKVLLKNCGLTQKQFETLLIDFLSDELLPNRKKSIERPKLRTDRDTVSRGSFDRTLAQARVNIAEAIYTVFLLGYTGLLETPQLEPFLEVGNRLKLYSEERRKISANELREFEDSVSRELSEVLMAFLGGKGSR
ncbi:hypothetical protein KEJ39_00300 [Candidatus Bathyarchaeota archaeon]|nr:hypothetical protein [Candidatus Bathyarchaeota archaeon]